MLSFFFKISECEERLLILRNRIKSEIQFHLYESIVEFIAFAFINVEFVDLDLIIEMIVDFKRCNTNDIRGKVTLF